jgi:hypothetical protein
LTFIDAGIILGGMTDAEKVLVSLVEKDIEQWESTADYFEKNVVDITSIDGKKTSGKDYAKGLRERAAEFRELLKPIKART